MEVMQNSMVVAILGEYLSTWNVIKYQQIDKYMCFETLQIEQRTSYIC